MPLFVINNPQIRWSNQFFHRIFFSRNDSTPRLSIVVESLDSLDSFLSILLFNIDRWMAASREIVERDLARSIMKFSSKKNPTIVQRDSVWKEAFKQARVSFPLISSTNRPRDSKENGCDLFLGRHYHFFRKCSKEKIIFRSIVWNKLSSTRRYILNQSLFETRNELLSIFLQPLETFLRSSVVQVRIRVDKEGNSRILCHVTGRKLGNQRTLMDEMCFEFRSDRYTRVVSTTTTTSFPFLFPRIF